MHDAFPMMIPKAREWRPQRRWEGGGGVRSGVRRKPEGGLAAFERLPVLLQSLDGLRPTNLRLFHHQLDVVLAYIWRGGGAHEGMTSGEGRLRVVRQQALQVRVRGSAGGFLSGSSVRSDTIYGLSSQEVRLTCLIIITTTPPACSEGHVCARCVQRHENSPPLGESVTSSTMLG
jgi:hypothetical protein